MSSSITISLEGDTFESISRRVYGDNTKANLIANSNPGITQPFVFGVTLTIPDDPDAPQNFVFTPSTADENQVSLLIDGREYTFFESITINRSIDSFDQVTFTAPFEADNADFREIFRPFKYRDIKVFVGDSLFFTGTMIISAPQLSPDRKSLTINCYARPGVLNDCQVPSSAFPIEYRKQGLEDIAISICKHFGLGVEFRNNQGPVFDSVTCGIDQTPYAFLTALAKQRGFVISNDKFGLVVFQSSNVSGPSIANFEEGSLPLIDVVPFFDGQNYHSSITGIAPQDFSLNNTEPLTVQNDHLRDSVRPHTFIVQDSDSAGDMQAAVDSKMGRMFGNLANYNIRVPTWRDPQNEFWTPNTFINLLAPDAMIYSKYKFMIRSVVFSKFEDNLQASLNLVMPGAFNGLIPETLPWDEP